MAQNQFSRTRLIFGKDNMEKLSNSKVLVFGVGGVGGYVCEALARSGVGTIGIVDDDKVCITNINRQIIATLDTFARYKVDVMEERIKSISKKINVNKYQMFYLPENSGEFHLEEYDYIVDCIDTVTAKIDIILKAQALNIPIISCMGMGNKINPLDIKIGDIYKTSVCPLARVMRYELRKRRVKKLKVCYSTEKPIRPIDDPEISCRMHCVCPPGTRKCTVRRDIPGSTAFVPSTAGLVIASEVVKDITGISNK